MNILATFNDNDFEPTDYEDRPTVKAVILNDKDEVLLFAGRELPGGGVEIGETNEEALSRECVEEIGATISIHKEIGNAITYRDSLNLKYVFTAYKCSLISLDKPTTIQQEEKGKFAIWVKREDAITKLESQISDVKSKWVDFFGLDEYQRKVFNREVTILFLKAIDQK